MKYLLLIAAYAALTTSPLHAQDVVAITGGRVMTVAGPVIDNGVVMIRNGRIEKVGKADEIEVPWEAKVIDATGKVVMPTWVLAHSQGGLRGANENMQNVPFVSVADALDPASPWFEDCLRNGVGSVHTLPGNDTLLGGTGMVVRPYGRTVEDMAVSTRTGIKMSLKARGGGRLQQIRRLRRVFEDARTYLADYERRKAEFESEKAAGVIAEDKEWEEEIDRTKKPAIDLIQKKVKGWLYVPGSAEVPEALRLAKDIETAGAGHPGRAQRHAGVLRNRPRDRRRGTDRHGSLAVRRGHPFCPVARHRGAILAGLVAAVELCPPGHRPTHRH